MFLVKLQFDCFENTTISAVDRAVNGVMEALRYNGQVLGREFPIVLHDGVFQIRCVCPDEDSLHPRYHSPAVKAAFALLTDAGLLSPKVTLLGRDINSEDAADCEVPTWQVLYTTYVHTCSPLRSGDSLLPIPLHRLEATGEVDHTELIQWQTQWQACDEIQMGGLCDAEHSALAEICNENSALFKKGRVLADRIENMTQVPTYYYQYRVGGVSLQSEQDRTCPICHDSWQLSVPLHGIFHFKCNKCRLVSNLSWDFAE